MRRGRTSILPVPTIPFFKFNNEHDWPYNEFYDGWWGHDTRRSSIMRIPQNCRSTSCTLPENGFLRPTIVDGWRLDVAADLGHSPGYNHLFWKEFRRVREGGKSRGGDYRGALRRCQLLAEGGRVGYCNELRRLYGASFLVPHRYGEAP